MKAEAIPFFKYHAIGNDYFVLREADVPQLSPEEIIRLCHRNFGIGSDGILLECSSATHAAHRVRIFNPDGGEAEKSGNGLRIFSRYLWDSKKVSDAPFQVETLGGVVGCQVLNDGQAVRVEMGPVRFLSSVIPMTGEPREVLSEEVTVGGSERVQISAATIGNPHCIVLSEQPTRALAERLGPQLETHPAFPARTNVQFVKVQSRTEIFIEIWERGAGYTLASGSSASATAAVLKRLGLVDSQVTVKMPGGELSVMVNDDYEVTMQGPVTRVAEGICYRECLR